MTFKPTRKVVLLMISTTCVPVYTNVCPPLDDLCACIHTCMPSWHLPEIFYSAVRSVVSSMELTICLQIGSKYSGFKAPMACSDCTHCHTALTDSIAHYWIGPSQQTLNQFVVRFGTAKSITSKSPPSSPLQ